MQVDTSWWSTLSTPWPRSSPSLTRHAVRLGHGAAANAPVAGLPVASVSMEEPIVDIVHQLHREGGILSRGGEDNGQQPLGRDMTTVITALSKRVERLQV